MREQRISPGNHLSDIQTGWEVWTRVLLYAPTLFELPIKSTKYWTNIWIYDLLKKIAFVSFNTVNHMTLRLRVK